MTLFPIKKHFISHLCESVYARVLVSIVIGGKKRHLVDAEPLGQVAHER